MEDDITEKYVDYLATFHRKLQFAKRQKKKDIGCLDEVVPELEKLKIKVQCGRVCCACILRALVWWMYECRGGFKSATAFSIYVDVLVWTSGVNWEESPIKTNIAQDARTRTHPEFPLTH